MTPESDLLKRRVEELEKQVKTLLLRTAMSDPSRVNNSPNGYIEAAIGGVTVRIPYYST